MINAFLISGTCFFSLASIVIILMTINGILEPTRRKADRETFERVAKTIFKEQNGSN